jgi:chromosomal replication initiation ATPase DnaA
VIQTPQLLTTVLEVERSTDRLLSACSTVSRRQAALERLTIYQRGVVAAAASAFRLGEREIVSPSRRRGAVAARTAVAIILREAGYSLPQIGRVLKRDHTTIMHCLSSECMARKVPGFLERLEMARGARP